MPFGAIVDPFPAFLLFFVELITAAPEVSQPNLVVENVVVAQASVPNRQQPRRRNKIS